MVKLFIKNKYFSVKGESTVKNEDGSDALLIKGKFWTLTRKKFVCDLQGNVVYKIRNKFFNFFNHYAYIYDANGTRIAKVVDKFFTLGKVEVKGYKDDIKVDGHWYSLGANILKNGQVAGSIQRKIDIRDSFVLQVEDPQDAPFMVALVVAVDNITDKKHRNV